MKMKFEIVFQGENSVEEKFLKANNEKPSLTQDLIVSWAQALMLGIGLTKADNLSIISFKAGKIDETPPSTPEVKKEVEK